MNLESDIEWYFSIAECFTMILACLCLKWFVPLLIFTWGFYGLQKYLMNKYHIDTSPEELQEKIDKL